VSDVVATVKLYARQETIEPLKGAIRWVIVGIVASFSLGLSMVLCLLAVLRLSQDLGGTTLAGSWSFVHYFITMLVGSLLVALTISRISHRSLSRGN
jgi:hypothetical protein